MPQKRLKSPVATSSSGLIRTHLLNLVEHLLEDSMPSVTVGKKQLREKCTKDRISEESSTIAPNLVTSSVNSLYGQTNPLHPAYGGTLPEVGGTLKRGETCGGGVMK